MPVATDTFKLCLIPFIGISKWISANSANSSETPSISLPTIKHIGKLIFISKIFFDSLVC